MTKTPDFGDLRSLFNQQHTPQVWDQLCQWISAFDDDESRQRILPYIEGHLLKWSDEERKAPKPWIDALLEDKPAPWMFIARSASLKGRCNARKGSWRHNDLGLQFFIKRDELEHLHHLDLGDNYLDDSDLEIFLKGEHFTNLKSLDLQRNEMTTKGLKALSESPLRLRLERLSLRLNNTLDADAIMALLKQPWPALKHLDLYGTNLTQENLADLEQAKLPNLISLNLGKNKLKAANLSKLNLPKLKALNLDQSELQDQHLQQLTHGASLPSLTQLTLWANAISDEGLTLLLNSPLFSQLEELNLGKNKLTRLGASALAQSTRQTSLTQLNLFGNPLDDSAYKALASAPLLSQLTELNLGADQATNAGKKTLLKSAHLSDELIEKLSNH